MRSRLAATLVGSGLVCTAGLAFADDAGAALDQLRQGYALKEQGRCTEAVPHFEQSVRLDPQPKALLNLSDCEEKGGDLVQAHKHAIEARDLAQRQGNAELLGIAEERLAVVERRMPRLTIRLAAEAAPGTFVVLDGVALDASSLGAPVAANPGKHVLTASASGHADRLFEITLREGKQQVIDVAAGDRLAETAPAPSPAQDRNIEPATGRTPAPVLEYVAFGVGGAGLLVGIGGGLVAGSKHSTLSGECNTTSGTCPPSAQGDLDDFHTWRTISTVGYVVGAAGLIAGATLWLLAPSVTATGAARTRLWFSPTSAGVAGGF